MIESDDARKNDLEAYILSMRSGISEGEKYGAFVKAHWQQSSLRCT